MTSHGDTDLCAQIITPSHTVQKLVPHYVYLLEVLVPHNFMMRWWMVFCKKIHPVMHTLSPIGI